MCSSAASAADPNSQPQLHLVGGVVHDRAVHHPWRRLRDQLPDWEVCFAVLPAGVLGLTDTVGRRIHLDSRQPQAQRRCTLDHELKHAEDGDVGCQGPKRERVVSQESARRLISLDRLLSAAVWAHGVEELAEELWVDVETLRCRIEHLHPAERAALRRAIASRDGRSDNEDPC